MLCSNLVVVVDLFTPQVKSFAMEWGVVESAFVKRAPSSGTTNMC